MQKYIHLLATLLIVAFILFGCSSGNSPTSPPLRDAITPRTPTGTGQMGLVGLWQIAVDFNNQTIEAVPARTSDLMLNVLGFMEPPALDKMTIDFDTMKINFIAETVEVDVIFTHPLVTPENAFQGFDVRGIVFGPICLNPDGYTAVMNPADFESVPFGYLDGMLGAPNSYASFDADYWPYKYFCDDLDATTEVWDFYENHADIAAHRGKFSEGATSTRHYSLSWAGLEAPLDFLVFNYAVYANFDWGVGDTPFTNDEFPITTANSAEAFCMSYTVVDNSLSYSEGTGAGEISLDIRVWDWQGLDSTKVTIESVETGVIAPVMVDFFGPGSDPFDGVVSFVDVPGEPTSVGDLDILVTVTDDSTTYGEAWFFGWLPTEHPYYNLPVENYWIITVPVGEEADCPTVEPVDIEAAPYNGTWLDELTEDTACACEVSTVGVSAMEWTHEPVSSRWNSGNSGGYYENEMDTMLIGPEILVPSTGAVEVDYLFDLSTDGSGDDWVGFGFLINGELTIVSVTSSNVSGNHHTFKCGGKTPGDIFNWVAVFTTDDTSGTAASGFTLNEITTKVFDPGDLPQVYPGGAPDPSNEICATGTPILTWVNFGAPIYALEYNWICDAYAGPLEFRWGGGDGEFYSWCIGHDGWMLPNYDYQYIWYSTPGHQACDPAYPLDCIYPFGDYTVTGSANVQVGAYWPTWAADAAGEVYYQTKDAGTANERFIIQYCDVGQIGEGDTANYRVILNGDDNTNKYDVRIEWLDVGTPGTTEVGAFMIWNGVYIEIQCDPADWASFEGQSVDIDQPDIY